MWALLDTLWGVSFARMKEPVFCEPIAPSVSQQNDTSDRWAFWTARSAPTRLCVAISVISPPCCDDAYLKVDIGHLRAQPVAARPSPISISICVHPRAMSVGRADCHCGSGFFFNPEILAGEEVDVGPAEPLPQFERPGLNKGVRSTFFNTS